MSDDRKVTLKHTGTDRDYRILGAKHAAEVRNPDKIAGSKLNATDVLRVEVDSWEYDTFTIKKSSNSNIEREISVATRDLAGNEFVTNNDVNQIAISTRVDQNETDPMILPSSRQGVKDVGRIMANTIKLASENGFTTNEVYKLEGLRQVVAAAASDDGKFDPGEVNRIRDIATNIVGNSPHLR